MNGWQKPVLAVLLAAVASSFLFAAGFWVGEGRRIEIPVFSDSSASGEFGGNGNQVISEAYRRIVDSAVEAPNEDALVRGAIKGMVEVLKDSGDPYALFYGARSFKEFQELTTGE